MQRRFGSIYWRAALALSAVASAGCASRPAPPAASPPVSLARLAGEVMAGPGSTGNADGGY
jgi:hypothetical protein